MNRKQEASKPRALVLGSTGRIGSMLVANLERTSHAVQVVYSSRKREQVEAWRGEGKEAVYLDLNDARSFPAALAGVDRLFLATAYNVDMVHQSKTIVDAAADANVKFIVHLGIFGNGRMTDPHFAWHEMVERYIEGSGIEWAHLHPHVFMDNLLTVTPVVNGKFVWFMGDKAVGWVAPEDVAAVAAQVLVGGREKHSGKQYWLSTEVLNGVQAAAEISCGLGEPVDPIVLTPDDLLTQVTSGATLFPPFVDANYGASILEWVRQTFDGRMDFGAVTTTAVEELTGRKPTTLRSWIERNRASVLEAGKR